MGQLESQKHWNPLDFTSKVWTQAFETAYQLSASSLVFNECYFSTILKLVRISSVAKSPGLCVHVTR